MPEMIRRSNDVNKPISDGIDPVNGVSLPLKFSSCVDSSVETEWVKNVSFQRTSRNIKNMF